VNRVLFVDDDVPVLDGLRARLHALRSRWDMVFVETAARAITEMEHRPCDVVVSDMRMPGIDGAELLKVVSERWPEAIRIVLSGYAESEQTARLLPIAHQYLSKPCEAQQIEDVVARCLKLRELLREPRLRQAVGRMRQLPAMPRTYAKLREIMSSDDPSVADVSRAISADSAIAAKVLQVVNSAFFRRAKSIAKIEQAVTHLGFVTIRNIVMSVEVFSAWPASLPQNFDPEAVQLRAHKVAAIARALVPGKAADDAMLAGLLHNIGYLVLAQQCPKELEAALHLAVQRRIPLHEAETEVIGASYAEIGAYLLGIWGLPHTIIEAVAFHNDPRRIKQSQFDVLAALATAETLVAADSMDTPGLPASGTKGVDETYLRDLGAPFDWVEAQQRAQHALGELQL
jgi:HD-like signal output (HDOD) protein